MHRIFFDYSNLSEDAWEIMKGWIHSKYSDKSPENKSPLKFAQTMELEEVPAQQLILDYSNLAADSWSILKEWLNTQYVDKSAENYSPLKFAKKMELEITTKF